MCFWFNNTHKEGKAAVIGASVFYYLDITIKPCHFHFSQNIHKKVVEICLKVEYG
jgi:hypothetical protein